jgi:8-oxo-dGTP diphosphatase
MTQQNRIFKMLQDELVSEDANPHGPWQDFEMSSGAVVYVDRPALGILLLSRSDGLLTLPKGHVEQNERADHAALRELHEETGIPSYDIRLESFLGYFTNPIILSDETRVLKVVSYYLFKFTSERLPQSLTGATQRPHIWLKLHQVDTARFAYTHIRDAIFAALDRMKRSCETPPPTR